MKFEFFTESETRTFLAIALSYFDFKHFVFQSSLEGILSLFQGDVEQHD